MAMHTVFLTKGTWVVESDGADAIRVAIERNAPSVLVRADILGDGFYSDITLFTAHVIGIVEQPLADAIDDRLLSTTPTSRGGRALRLVVERPNSGSLGRAAEVEGASGDACPECGHSQRWYSGTRGRGCGKTVESGPCNSDWRVCACRHAFHATNRCMQSAVSVEEMRSTVVFLRDGRCGNVGYKGGAHCELHMRPEEHPAMELAEAVRIALLERGGD